MATHTTMRTAYASAFAVSLLLAVAAHRHWIALGEFEVWGFITGAWCVWLSVRENIWTWPIGLANNVFFFILFLRARLFADMALQIIYFILSVLGWYWWLCGGQARSPLSIVSASKIMLGYVGSLVVVCTLALTAYLAQIGDSAPFADAITTSLSLGGQFLLSKKRLETWYFWITADIVYVWLYAQKGLFLTSVLYAVFLTMCLAGVTRWKTLRTPAASVATSV